MQLKEIRQRKKLSQNQLANLCGISQNYISELESGKHEATETIIIKLCLALATDPNFLLDWKS